MSQHTMHLSWTAHGDQEHYLWHLADGNEVRVVDGHGHQEFMEPEEAFLAALASCHLLSFLTEAAREGLSVASYDDDPQGVLGQNDQAKFICRPWCCNRWSPLMANNQTPQQFRLCTSAPTKSALSPNR